MTETTYEYETGTSITKFSDAILGEVQSLTIADELEKICQADNKVKLFEECAKALRAAVNERKFEWIEQNGDYVQGTVRHYIGVEKQTKCIDVPEAISTLLELGGKELLRDVLRSDPFKQGETRKRLTELNSADLFDKLFETTTKEELKEGKPVRREKLLSVDSRFIK